MSLTLTVDGPRWRAHLEQVAAKHAGLVPVAKGNGYGFTPGRLARKAQWLADRGHDVRTLAVGTYDELPEVTQRWHGDLLVLTPWRPWVPLPDAATSRRLVHTVSRLADLRDLLHADPTARFVLERMTSMRFSSSASRSSMAPVASRARAASISRAFAANNSGTRARSATATDASARFLVAASARASATEASTAARPSDCMSSAISRLAGWSTAAFTGSTSGSCQAGARSARIITRSSRWIISSRPRNPSSASISALRLPTIRVASRSL